jgi:hypothetical protein
VAGITRTILQPPPHVFSCTRTRHVLMCLTNSFPQKLDS